MPEYKDVKKVKIKQEEALLGYPNVVSLGIGFKYTNGQKTSELSIIVGVRRKLSPFFLKKEELIPTTVNGIKTDVVQVKDLSLLPPHQVGRTERIRPPKPGFSIGNVAITAGTFGCVVHRAGEAFILSNAHVLCTDPTADMQLTRQIVQPGPFDGGKSPEDLIGNLEYHVPIFPLYEMSSCGVSSRISGGLTWGAKKLRRQSRFIALAQSPMVNYVDAAIARPTTEIVSEIEQIGLPQAVGDLNEGSLEMQVHKSGRTTGVTAGIIKQIDMTTMVNYGFKGFLPVMCLFMDQVAIEAPVGQPFSQGGDSGSAVLLTNGNVLCGLLFAGNEDGTQTIINKISNVFRFLNVSL